MRPPGAKQALALVARHAPKGAQALEVDDGAASLARELSELGLHVTSTRAGAALAAPGSADVVLCLAPTRFGALIPLLGQVRAALADGGVAVVTDLVWQTAPTPELIRAFSVPGREKVRPVEGFEMQAEHAGFEIIERAEVERDDVLASYQGPQRDAIAADERGAARVCAWALRKA